MGRGFNIPWRGVDIPCVGDHKIMGRGVDVPGVGVPNSMGMGSTYHF